MWYKNYTIYKNFVKPPQIVVDCVKYPVYCFLPIICKKIKKVCPRQFRRGHNALIFIHYIIDGSDKRWYNFRYER